MIEPVINELAARIGALGFVSQSCGLSREFSVSSAGEVKTVVTAPAFPTWVSVEVSPDIAKNVITFFTASPTRVVDQNIYMMRVENEIAINGWINGDTVSMSPDSDPELEIINAVRKAGIDVSGGGSIRSVEIDYIGSEQPDVSRFGWNEANFQYGAFPHKLFRHILKVSCVVSKGCETSTITVTAKPC